MSLNKANLGKRAEKSAKQFLVSKGHKIIFSNFKNKYAEIDLITTKNKVLHLVEVKSTNGINLNPYFTWTKTQRAKMAKLYRYSGLFNKYIEWETKIVFIWFALLPNNELKLVWILEDIDLDYE